MTDLGKACRNLWSLMLLACIWTQVKWLDRGKELSCIVHVEFRGVLRLWEEFTAVFPQWTRSAYRLNSPTLGKDIYRESNGTKTQRNRSQSLQKPQWRQVNRQRSSGKDFFTDNPFVFSNWRKKRFFPIQILIILPLHNDQRSAGLISHIAWGTCELTERYVKFNFFFTYFATQRLQQRFKEAGSMFVNGGKDMSN